jgi:hypothetical protein
MTTKKAIIERLIADLEHARGTLFGDRLICKGDFLRYRKTLKMARKVLGGRPKRSYARLNRPFPKAETDIRVTR